MEWSLDLRRQIGIPHTLAELGVKESHLDQFAEMAAVDPTAGGNPVKAGVRRCARCMRRRGGPPLMIFCHPERSEDLMTVASGDEVLRCAQDDK